MRKAQRENQLSAKQRWSAAQGLLTGAQGAPGPGIPPSGLGEQGQAAVGSGP